MNKPANDILQIKKYLEGRLDSHSMHELERRALDDPFLADALEGYEAAGHQQTNLTELSDRLQNRTDKKIRRMIPWAQISVAASLLIIIGAGTWRIVSNKPQKDDAVANLIKADKHPSPTVSSPSAVVPSNADTLNLTASNAQPKSNAPTLASPRGAVEESKPAHKYYSNSETLKGNPSLMDKNTGAVESEKPISQPPGNADQAEYKPVMRDSAAANEIAVQQMASKAKTLKEVSINKTPQTSPETPLQGHVEGLDVQPAHKDLTGYVIAANGGQPLVGAIVKLSGAPFGVATDANGKFVMHNVPEKKNLVVGYLGYSTKQVKIGSGDSINVSLEPAGSALAEVVVTKNKNLNNATSVGDVHPSAGWKALNDYLDANATSSDGLTGQVKLSFMVDGKGALSNFKIIKSLSDTADKKAIDLITNGPAWSGGIDGQSHEVKLIVKFR